jgi:hypothetical protein
MSNQKIGYDQLLHDRVKQLEEIQERLEWIMRTAMPGEDDAAKILRLAGGITLLLRDISYMILRAEAEHTAF